MKRITNGLKETIRMWHTFHFCCGNFSCYCLFFISSQQLLPKMLKNGYSSWNLCYKVRAINWTSYCSLYWITEWFRFLSIKAYWIPMRMTKGTWPVINTDHWLQIYKTICCISTNGQLWNPHIMQQSIFKNVLS